MATAIKYSGIDIPVKLFQFSGGELQVSANITDKATYEMVARISNATDIMELLLLDEILCRHKQQDSVLTIPYLPYGRQDRVMHGDEAFSLKVMAKLLNGLCFDKIVTYDCHSPVTNALVNNLQEIDQSQIISAYAKDAFLEIIHKSIVIAPDAGASKKTYKIANCFKRPMVIAEKVRDTSTGAILRTKVDVSGCGELISALILDDICDGGRTFIELAKALRDQGIKKIYLYVTHGIFSQGLDVFDGLIDHIFTTDTFRIQQENPLLTTFKIIG